MSIFRSLVFLLLAMPLYVSSTFAQPLRVGIAGLTHTHVHWILGREQRGDIEIVGISEPNRALAQRYATQHGYDMGLVHESLDKMIKKAKPDAILAFGSIREHLAVVEVCAPKGIHVMVEKPLALNSSDAQKMAALAEKHGIHLLVNYETTWYPTNHKAYALAKDGKVGDIRKIVVHDGHKGPSKLGINQEFLDWLLDPEENGGGAIMDFGCYGANLATWLMDGKKPLSVTAVTQQFQPENNPKVDDEATIILTYPKASVVIGASWNWPIGRKDMAIYGLNGVIYADNRHQLRIHMAEGYDGYTEEKMALPERKVPYDDPFAYFAGVIHGKVVPKPYGLSGLKNNMIVMEILDAARESAKTGTAYYFK